MFSSFVDLEVAPLRRRSAFGLKQSNLKGPSRVVRLCILGVLLPTLMIAVPLYLRYRVYRHQFYPLTSSEMRIIDGRISTIWCQRQLLSANATFNAYLLAETPKISDKIEPTSVVRQLTLEDDMKEYWGFYLLKGSSVRVSTCVRWPGASLIVIRGHKHLHECAYIGDNSSEEMDEEKGPRDDGPANRPQEMHRHLPDVEFLFPPALGSSSNKSIIENHPGVKDEDISDADGDIKQILNRLQNKTKINKKEWKVIDIQAIEAEGTAGYSNLTSEEVIRDIFNKLKNYGTKSDDLLKRLNRKFENQAKQIHKNKKKREIFLKDVNILREAREHEDVAQEEGFHPEKMTEQSGVVLEASSKDTSNSEFWSSFSSSEEALLNCAGLILNLPLTPHHQCTNSSNDQTAKDTSLRNTFIYRVPVNGYYFFVFNSENEVQKNFLRVQFDMEKTVYDVSKPLAVCSNVTSKCALDLAFFSNQKVVLQMPTVADKNEGDVQFEFVAESECEPRSTLYAICVLAVPVIFILFAFT